MLMIIVVYLMYSSSVNGELVGKSCIEPHFNCLRQKDCCSNYCRKVNEEVFGTCASEPNGHFSPTVIKINACFKPGHFCIENSDCCSKDCIAVKSHFHGLFRACAPIQKSDKYKLNK